MDLRETRWAGLDTQVFEPAAAGQPIGNVVLCHGYGAPGGDLVPLAPTFFKFAPALHNRIRFIFPAASLDLEDIGMPDGRAWWHFDIGKLQQTIAAGRSRDLLHESPAGLPPARDQFIRLLNECAAETGIPLARTVIGGFSQGAMLATDVALHLPNPPAGLLILSGMLINQSSWSEQLQHRSGLPVFQSHGRYDPLLPFELAGDLRDALEAAGNPVEFCEFPGAHEIPFEAMKGASAFLQQRFS